MAASDSEGGVQGTTPRPVRRKVENEEIKVGWVTVDDDDAPDWGCCVGLVDFWIIFN